MSAHFPLRRRALLAIAAATGAAWSATAQAQQRLVHMVVPYGTGAVQDTVARAFSAELGQALGGASVVVENRAGAGGSVGSAYVAKSAPDGNTLLLAAASHHIAGYLYAKLPYRPLQDFVGVAQIGTADYVIAASATMPGVATLADFVREVKAKPGRYNYASAGNGSATHLAMASFLAKAGLEMTHIPMKSTGEAVNEVLAGRVQAVASSTIGVIGLQTDPRVRLLAGTGKVRSAFLPQLPTVAEAGVPGYSFDSWIGVLAPAATPPAEVDKLNAAINQLMAEPALQERFKRIGVEPHSSSPAAFAQLLRNDWEAMGAVVKASGARIE